jgi:hypothetical protein
MFAVWRLRSLRVGDCGWCARHILADAPSGTIIARIARSIESSEAAMNPSEIYAKTDRGLQELRDNTLNLPAMLRDLLAMIDGHRTVLEVLASAKALKLDGRALRALERGGLIASRTPAFHAVRDEATQPPPPTSDEVERYAQAQQMMSDAIHAHLGFRGYDLSMRLRKTGNVRDLHDLLPDFAKALVKRLGIEPATPVVASIERLISGT